MQAVERRELEEGAVEPGLLRAGAGGARAPARRVRAGARRRAGPDRAHELHHGGVQHRPARPRRRPSRRGRDDRLGAPGLFGGLVASGATLRIAAIRDLPVAEILTAIQARITPRTASSASPTSWLNGAVLPVGELAEHGVPVLVDGAQAAGAIPVAVEELGADFYRSPRRSGFSARPRPARSTWRTSPRTAASPSRRTSPGSSRTTSSATGPSASRIVDAARLGRPACSPR